MASIFYRGKPPAGSWWVQYYHPRSGEMTRFSLATGDRYTAEVIRRRVELEVDLRRPELQLQPLPPPVLEDLGPAFPEASPKVILAPEANLPGASVESKPRATTADLLKLYWGMIQEENVAEHQSNKLSLLRHFFGGALVAEVTGVACRSMPAAYFEGQFTDDITHQLDVLRDCPPLLAAAQLMIHAGLRRAEALWLTKDSINNLEYLSVRTQYDEESGDDLEQDPETPEVGTLKTEASTRSVSILPPLREFLEAYLPTLEGDWLVPNPWKSGQRWDKGNFSSALRKLNRKHSLRWNCLHYRHTYATARCAEGWNVWDLANEMGTSIAMIQKHYAAFLQPARLQRQSQTAPR